LGDDKKEENDKLWNLDEDDFKNILDEKNEEIEA
jgi:hypothetical protein